MNKIVLNRVQNILKKMQDYIFESEYGMQDMVITDPNTRIDITGNDILKRMYNNNGYAKGNKWETPQDSYFQKVLLERSYAAVLKGDFNTADIYLALNYWNEELLDNIRIKAEEARIQGEYDVEIMLNRVCEYGKVGDFQCKALYFVLWKRHIGLLEYILAKINPQNISTMDLAVARKQQLGKYLCKKDPVRFYMGKKQFGGGLFIDIPLMRTPQQQREYVLNQEAKYIGLLIHKLEPKTKDNIVLTGIPKEVLRYTLAML